MKKADFVTVKLTAPTVFSDLNAKEEKDSDFARDEVIVRRLKFKVFREMNKLPEDKQIIFAITKLTGLSEADVDELYAEDAAYITKEIIGFMQAFIDITKNLLKPE